MTSFGRILATAAAMIALLAAGLVISRAWADRDRPLSEKEIKKYSKGTVDVAKLLKATEKLRPLQSVLPKPKRGDWLYHHKEPGQTFAEYLRCWPVRPVGRRKVIYIQPLGKFTDTQRKIVKLTADYMGRYFNVKMKVRKDLPLSVIPPRARRTHPAWGDKQILSTYVLDNVLRPRLPADAAAYIAFTASDLWPGEGWNFVYGQASLRRRVGVWSIYRNGDPDKSKKAYLLCLRRTLKTATHETGHMFSMRHCIAWQCNMCGSNHRAESDRHPLWLCPQCLAKVCWAAAADPVRRYKKLVEFCKANGLEKERKFFEKSIKALGGKGTTRPVTKKGKLPKPSPSKPGKQ